MSEVFIVIREPNHYEDSVDVYGVFDNLVNAQRTAADLNEKNGWKQEQDGEPYTVMRKPVSEHYYAPSPRVEVKPVGIPMFDTQGVGHWHPENGTSHAGPPEDCKA